jgi:transglutaminase-like putative cysteine protease
MKLRVGYELIYDCPQPTPMVLMLNIHHTRAGDIIVPDRMTAEPFVPMTSYWDRFGNWCTRIVAPAGRLRLSASSLLNDTGQPDAIARSDHQHAVQDLPDESLEFLLGSRYCETDRLTGLAWDLFGKSPAGARRIYAICDYVHRHITFNYQNARSTRTAWEAFQEGTGVCRDYAHLAIAFCRCMNIPARYCTGYLGDMGVPPPYGPMDFAAWFEAYIGGRWYIFDPRNNVPRIGRVLIARGRDATDVAISNTFGPNTLAGFTVWTDEVKGALAEAGVGNAAATTCAS